MLLDIQANPVSLSHLIVSLVASDAKSKPDAPPPAELSSAGAASLQLPSEAQPLMRLLEHAQRNVHQSKPHRLDHLGTGGPILGENDTAIEGSSLVLHVVTVTAAVRIR